MFLLANIIAGGVIDDFNHPLGKSPAKIGIVILNGKSGCEFHSVLLVMPPRQTRKICQATCQDGMRFIEYYSGRCKRIYM
jgi:hypothetical protein